MNVYSILPLIALFANSFLCFYILYINPKNRLNQFFSLVVFSLAVWSLSNYYMFNASSVSQALAWNNVATLGVVFTSIFLFHFSIIFAKMKMTKKMVLFILVFYATGLLLVFTEISTTLFTLDMHPSYWGFSETPGPYYFLLSLFIIIAVSLGILFCYLLYKKTSSKRVKKQSKFVILGFSIPLIGGTITQVIAPYFTVEILPLSSTLTTITAVVIGFTVFKHKLLKPKSFGIQKKMVVMFFVLLFISIFFTLSILSVVSTEIIEEEVSDELRAIAQSRANHVETLIHREIEQLQLVSSGTKLRESLKEYNVEATAENKEIMKRIIHDANQSIESFHDIIILNISGVGIVSTDSMYENTSYLEKVFFKEGKKNNSLFFLLEDTVPKMYTSGPLVLNGETLGVIVIISSPEVLFDVMTDKTGLGQTGESYIVNETGYVITPLRFYNHSYNMNHVLFRLKIDTENYHNSMLHATYFDEELKMDHEEVEIFKDYRNVTVLGTHVFIPEMNWALLVEIDESEAFAAVNNMQTIMTIILSISGGVILIIAYIYSKSISKPIQDLNRVAEEITDGNLNINVNINSKDEIGNLAKSFNVMTQSLKRHTENLETQVEKRTKDLQEKVDELQLTREKLADLTEHLEQKVQERTKEVNRLLDQKNAFIDQLGHDLKHPLGPFINLIPLLKRNETDEKKREILTVLERNVEYMKRLVIRTLKIAKLNAPSTSFEFKAVNLKELVQTVAEKNKALLDQSDVALNKSIDENITLKADRLQIEEVFENLLSNAVKYGSEHGNIFIRAEKQSDQNMILISVKDNGKGMTSDQIDNAFNEFYKADESRHDFKDTGLGLSICKKIIEKHGGDIWAESEGLGKGTTIYFTLPLTKKKKYRTNNNAK